MPTPSSSALFELLAHLATNPDDAEDFKNDPEAFMNTYETANNVQLVQAHKALVINAVDNNKQIDLYKAIGDAGHALGIINET